MLPATWSLALYQPLSASSRVLQPQDVIKLDPELASVQYTTALPGGFNALTLTLPKQAGGRLGYLPQPFALAEFGHLELWAGDALVWEGRFAYPDYDGPALSAITGQGYGVWGVQDVTFTSDANELTSGLAVLLTALGALPVAYQIGDTGSFMDTGVQHTLAELDGQTVNAVIDQLSKEGSASGNLFDFTCYENRQVAFKPRVCPTDANGNYLPDYQIEHRSQLSTLRLDYTNTVGGVYVRYTEAASNAQARTDLIADPTFLTRYGLFRTTTLSAGTMSKASAYQYGLTYLTVNKYPAVSAKLTLPAGEWLSGPLGNAVPAYLARAGEWVQLGDEHDLPLIPPQIIVRTQTDPFAGTTEIEFGNPAPGYNTDLQALRKVAQRVSAGLNPGTSAPL